MKPGHTLLPSHVGSWRQRLWRSYVQLLKRSTWPILVGPWHGEVGFEVLYWIPFLEQLKAEGIAPDRLVPITRGGAGAWYHVPQGLELFAMRTPQQVRIENRIQADKRGLLKQVQVTAFDRAVLVDAAETLRLGRGYHVLHPAWMYHLLAPYWTGLRGFTWLNRYAAYPALPLADVPDTLRLPDAFIAARFYHRETWPLSHKLVCRATEALLQKAADQQPVVILESETVADEHVDFPVPKHPNLIRLRDLYPVRPETNLFIQGSVLARAQGFIGVYGGMAQLALRMRKPVATFFQEWGGTSIVHRHLSEQLALQAGLPFLLIRAQEIPLLSSLLPESRVIPRGEGTMLDTRNQTPLSPELANHAIVAP